MEFFDAHFHLAQSLKACPESAYFSMQGGADSFSGISCSHEKEEFELEERLAKKLPHRIFLAFGMHPQNPDTKSAEFLERVLREGRASAVGEAGFDFFSPQLRAEEKRQDEAFSICASLAAEHGVPIILHMRKSLDKIFEREAALKKIPSVIFHAFPFTEREARSILSRGINAFFSFGNSVFAKGRRVSGCMENIPKERILIETDAPFQPPKGLARSDPAGIRSTFEFCRENFGMDAPQNQAEKISLSSESLRPPIHPSPVETVSSASSFFF